MKLSSFSKVIELTFLDKMTVYNYSEYEEPTVDPSDDIPIDESDKTTDVVINETPYIVDKPCKLSFINLENAADTNIDSNPIMYVPKLFFSINDILKVGDYVVVKRTLDTEEVIVYEGNIGLPTVFPTHKEVLFLVDGVA